MAIKDFKKGVSIIGANAAEAAKAAGNTAAKKTKVVGGVAAEKARVVGGKVAAAAKEKSAVIAAKAQESAEIRKISEQERKLRKLAPVTAEEYFSDDYDLPYLIVIVDEDQRKGEELCEGAIGWLSTQQDGMEILNMYYEFVPESGINFFPKPQMQAAYYIDAFDKSRYIDVERIFNVSEQDQATELRNIAYCLGAKSCRLLSVNSQQSQEACKTRKNGNTCLPIKGIQIRADVDAERCKDGLQSSDLAIMFEQQFEGSDKPIIPELKWFSDNQEILSLIDMRCGNKPNNIKKYTVNIDASQCSSVKEDQAIKIDAALSKVKLKASANMQKSIRNRMRKTLLFEIEF